MDIVQAATVQEGAKAPAARTAEWPVFLYLGVAAAAAALIWTYWLVLPGLVRQWWNEDEYSHGFLVPLISIGLVWYRWERLRTLPIRRAYSGILLIGLSLAAYATGIIGADLFVQRLSMVAMIWGATLYVTGWTMFTALAFPLGYLLLMIPLPGILFNTIAFPLQLLAAQIASNVMQVCAVPVLREGNIMHLASVVLDVEEACSGIRSLISLTALGVVFAYVTESRWLTRAIIVALIAPIAVVANVLRVTVTGLLAHYVSPETAIGLFHEVGGLFVFLLASVLLLAVSRTFKLVGVSR